MNIDDITTSITELSPEKQLELIKERRLLRHTYKKRPTKKKKSSTGVSKRTKSKPKKKQKSQMELLLESVPAEKRDLILKQMKEKYG